MIKHRSGLLLFHCVRQASSGPTQDRRRQKSVKYDDKCGQGSSLMQGVDNVSSADECRGGRGRDQE